MTERQSGTAASRVTGYIPEVQGLRTIALVLVAIYHIWFGRVSGGVDVFLVISTYLMTRSLTARAEAGAITRPVRHLLGKFARLLPAAVTAIVLTLVAVCILQPATTWDAAVESARASLFYVENIHLQDRSVDYLNPGDTGPSPFQHFWSLSVQGQAFILWALLHCAGDLIARFGGFPPRWVHLALFTAVFGASFGYAIQLVAVDQPYAYFDTVARLWEFAAGAILALIQPWLRVPQRLRPWLAWIGIAGVVTCGWLLPVEASFPGWAALWPVAATAFVILSTGSNVSAAQRTPDRVLAHPALASAGNYTYALYLIHWPVLVLFLAAVGTAQANWWQGILVLTVSIAVSILVVRCIERPTLLWLRRSRRERGFRAIWRPALTIALVVVIGLVTVTGASALGTAKIASVREHLASLEIAYLGANAADLALAPDDSLRDFVRKDTSVPGEACAPADADSLRLTELCFDLSATSGDDPERKVLAIGNSHTIQFNGALLEAVERQPTWSLHTRGGWSCTIERAEDISEECAALWPAAHDWIAQEQPDLVVLFGTQSTLTQEISQWALLDWIAEARELAPDAEFAAVRDNPRFDRNLIDCAAEFGADAPECRAKATDDLDPDFVAELVAAGVIWIDLHDVICPNGYCTPAQGGLWVFQDDNHLTDTYTRSLAQELADQLPIDWWPRDVYGSGELQDRTPAGDITNLPLD